MASLSFWALFSAFNASRRGVDFGMGTGCVDATIDEMSQSKWSRYDLCPK